MLIGLYLLRREGVEMPDVGSVCSACFALLQSFQPTAVLVCFIQAFNSAKTCLREQYHPQKAHLYVIINIVPQTCPVLNLNASLFMYNASTKCIGDHEHVLQLYWALLFHCSLMQICEQPVKWQQLS